MLMSQAKIYWDRDNYPMVERIFRYVRHVLLLRARSAQLPTQTVVRFADAPWRVCVGPRQSAEFCSEHEIWKLNVAHVFFMQETKFKEVTN